MRPALLLMMVMGHNTFAYRAAWLHTIYVATTGNDSTGNGSKATPYKTLTKAMTVAIAGDGILLANGTYAENTGGNNVWAISKNLADWLTIEPEIGAPGNGTVTGVAGSYAMWFENTCAFIKMRYLTFTPVAGAAYCVRNLGTINNVRFEYCTFLPVAGEGYGYYAGVNTTGLVFDHCVFAASPTDGYRSIQGDPNGITLQNCTFLGMVATNSYLLNLVTTTVGHTMVIDSCSFEGGPCISANGGTYIVNNCAIKGTAAATCVLFGVNSTTGNVTTATITNCTIQHDSTKTGHALNFGAGCLNCVADNITISECYDYACVVKECTGTEIKNCHLMGGSQAALYYKAATSPNAHDNVLTATAGYAVKVAAGDTGNKSSGVDFQHNIIEVTGTAGALNWAGSAGDNGGGVCDYNTYIIHAGASLGTVRGTVVTDLASLQAAWAGYGDGSNDSHSTVTVVS